MSSPISSSSLQQHEAVQRVSTLNKVYKDCQANQSVVFITIIAMGIICILSGVVLLSLAFILAFSLLPAQISVFLGAILIGVGSALIAFGVTKYFAKLQTVDQDQMLAEELLKTKLLAEEKGEEVTKLHHDMETMQEALQRQTKSLKEQLDEAKEQYTLLLSEREESTIVMQASQSKIVQLQSALEEVKIESQNKAAKIQDLETMVKNNQIITDAIILDMDKVVSSQRKTISQKDQEIAALKRQVQDLTLQVLSSGKSSSTSSISALSIKSRFLESSFGKRWSSSSGGTNSSPVRSIESGSSSDSEGKQQQTSLRTQDEEDQDTCSSSDSNLS